MSDQSVFHLRWIDAQREPECPPNPAYPDGIEVDASEGAAITCIVALPYPAKRCGYHLVQCKLCGMKVACTTAGRPDDPRSIKVPCKNISAQAS